IERFKVDEVADARSQRVMLSHLQGTCATTAAQSRSSETRARSRRTARTRRSRNAIARHRHSRCPPATLRHARAAASLFLGPASKLRELLRVSTSAARADAEHAHLLTGVEVACRERLASMCQPAIVYRAAAPPAHDQELASREANEHVQLVEAREASAGTEV